MIVDKGEDFPQPIDAALKTYGESMWLFREQPGTATTRALNSYTGDHREYVPGGYHAYSRTHRINLLTRVFVLLPQASNT
jgi:hypothetical protein